MRIQIAMSLIVAAFSMYAAAAEKLVEVSTSTFGLMADGKVFYLDYVVPNPMSFYAAIYQYDLETGTNEVVLPIDGSSPYYIHYGLSGDYLPFISMTDDNIIHLEQYNRATNSAGQLISDTSWKESVWAGEQYVVWVDYRHVTATDSINGEIYLYNRTDNTVERVTSTSWWEGRPATDGHTLVWVSYENGTYGNVYYRDVEGGTAVAVSPGNYHQDNPRVSGNYIVWEDYRNAGTDSSNADIYAFDMESGAEIEICVREAFQGNPYLHGSIVVWEDYRNATAEPNNADIYAYDLSAGVELEVTVEPGYQGNPTVFNDSACWLGMDSDGSMWLYLDTIQRDHDVSVEGKKADHGIGIQTHLDERQLVISGLEDAAVMKVSLFDIRGRLVGSLIKETQMPITKWTFDRRVSPGRYIVSVETNKGVFRFKNEVIY